MAGKVSTSEQVFSDLRSWFQLYHKCWFGGISLLLWVWHDNIEVCSLFVDSEEPYLTCPLIG